MARECYKKQSKMICEINLIRYNTPIIFPSFQVWRFKCFCVEQQLDHRPDDEFGNEKSWQMMMSENNSWTVKNRFWAIFLHHGVALSWVFCRKVEVEVVLSGCCMFVGWRRSKLQKTKEMFHWVWNAPWAKFPNPRLSDAMKKLLGFWGLNDQGI